MKQLREMMVQLLQARNNGTGAASMQEVQTVQNAASNNSAVVLNGGAGVQNHATDAISTNADSTVVTNTNVTTHIQSNRNISTNGNMRHASVKEIANTLSEFNPTNNASITVEQFIGRVDRVVEAFIHDQEELHVCGWMHHPHCTQLVKILLMRYDTNLVRSRRGGNWFRDGQCNEETRSNRKIILLSSSGTKYTLQTERGSHHTLCKSWIKT
uniref:Uncharacterized protein n=1 Tax=Bactrocera latifrons TaxID=174628 RepID=A0A0K8ULR6_BACLA